MKKERHLTHLLAAALSVTTLCAMAPGQIPSDLMPTPVPPLGEYQQRTFDSGLRANAGDRSMNVFSEVVHTPNAAWTRLFFSEARLDPGTVVRVTSLQDGEVQELDAADMAMWNNSTAYFNGDTLLVELIAAPHTDGNRLQLSEVQVGILGAKEIALCGICGIDDRTPSDEDWVGRLANPGVCTASVININSCLVSAGHCIGGSNQVIQFRVPQSLPNCNLLHPPVADQFPIVDKIFNNGGVGADWAVMTTGTNNLGETIYERYGEYRRVAFVEPKVGQAVEVWGYGASETCTAHHTQQLSTGNIVDVFQSAFAHTADTTGGNSGSSILHNNEIIGIVTHCPCPNIGNRIDITTFSNAIKDLCPDPTPPNDDCSGAFVVSEGVTPFSTIAATPDGPDEAKDCTFFGDDGFGSDIWFGHIAQCTGTLTVSLCGSSYNTKLAVYPFSCPKTPGSVLACDLISCPGELRSEVSLPVTAGQALRIRIGGHHGAVGEGLLTIWCEEESSCPADLTDDGAVDVSDMMEVLSAWGNCSDCPQDINGDGAVDVSDMMEVLSAWGPC